MILLLVLVVVIDASILPGSRGFSLINLCPVLLLEYIVVLPVAVLAVLLPLTAPNLKNKPVDSQTQLEFYYYSTSTFTSTTDCQWCQ